MAPWLDGWLDGAVVRWLPSQGRSIECRARSAQQLDSMARRIGMSMDRTTRNTWIGIGLLVLLVFAGLSAIGGGMMGHQFAEGYGGYGGGRWANGAPWMFGFGIFGMFLRVLVFGGLIVLAVGIFRRMRAARSDAEFFGGSDPSATEILRRRYAAGEITREQYDEMRQVLEPTSGHATT
jgi:putative membrane protein